MDKIHKGLFDTKTSKSWLIHMLFGSEKKGEILDHRRYLKMKTTEDLSALGKVIATQM